MIILTLTIATSDRDVAVGIAHDIGVMASDAWRQPGVESVNLGWTEHDEDAS